MSGEVYVKVEGGSGLSAYELWLAAGNTGSLAQYLATAGANLQPQLDAANAAAAQAGTNATSAQQASAAAQNFVNGILYSTVALGLAAVADGKYFNVIGDNPATASILYQRVGSAAVEKYRYPAGFGLGLLAQRAETGRVFSVTDYGAKGDGVTNDSPAFKLANAVCSLSGGGTVFVPNTGLPYMMGDEEFTNGSRPFDGGPFKRGIIKMLPGVSWASDSAEIRITGGRSYPGGWLYHAWWEGTTITDVSFNGLFLNGNLPNQVKAVYPAGTPDGNIWQHGHGITFGQWARVQIVNCEITGFVGNGVSMFDNYGAKVNNLITAPNVSNTLLVDNCSFHDLFGIGVGVGVSRNVEIKNCRFYGDGFWVGAITPEVLDGTGIMLDHWYHHNTFDFRGGRLPAESYPQFASNSAQAEAARKSLRRAVCGIVFTGYANNTFNENLRGLKFTDNLIYQGTFQAWNYAYVEVVNNSFFNYFEDMSNAYNSGEEAILISTGTNAIGTRGARVIGNTVESDLNSYGCTIRYSDDVLVAHNTFKNSRRGGLRLESSSGSVTTNRFVNTGRKVTAAELANDPAYSSAIQIFGTRPDSPIDIMDNVFIDNRSAANRGMQNGIQANLPSTPRCTIGGNRGFNLSGKVLNDTGGTAFQFGNTADNDRVFYTNVGFKAPGAEFVNLVGTGLTKLYSDLQLGNQVDGTGNAMTQYFINKRFSYQMGALTDGSFMLQAFPANSGAVQVFYVGANGRLNYPQDWSTPITYGSQLRLWADYSSGGIRLKYGSDPTAQDDGGLLSTRVNGIPASATATGSVGQWTADDSFLYICTGTNKWRRSALVAW